MRVYLKLRRKPERGLLHVLSEVLYPPCRALAAPSLTCVLVPPSGFLSRVSFAMLVRCPNPLSSPADFERLIDSGAYGHAWCLSRRTHASFLVNARKDNTGGRSCLF